MTSAPENVGTKVFRRCAYYEAEGFTFIWTQENSFIMDKKEMGDFVIIPYEHTTHATINKTTNLC